MTISQTDLALEVHESLLRRGATLAVAESLTGGGVGAALTQVPGVSATFRGGVIAYATEVKASLLGVDPALLARVGAVDPEVARRMAQGVRDRLGATYGLATTGVAGPDPQDGHPPGEVHLALAGPEAVVFLSLALVGDREQVRSEAVRRALEFARDHLRRGGTNLTDHVRGRLGDQLYDGLILQLRSIPVGFRVDAWVRDTFPALVEQQRASATRQLDEYQAALAPQIKKIAPEKIYRASLGMNAAFASFWGRELSDPSVTVPYKVAGLLPLGEELLAAADGLPSAPASDRALIRAWGDLLGVGDWYTFAPFGG